MSRAGAVVLTAVVLLGACGDDDPPTAGDGAAASTEASGSATSGAGADTSGGMTCPDPGTSPVPGCEAVLVVFPEPLDLAGVESAGEGVRGPPIALWRTDAVCIASPGTTPPATEPVPSRFAYWDADVMMDRRDEAPPATDGGRSQQLRQRFRAEWALAREPGVRFEAAVYHAPAPDGGDGEVLASYRTDGDGTLYLQDHAAALEAVLGPPTGTC